MNHPKVATGMAPAPDRRALLRGLGAGALVLSGCASKPRVPPPPYQRIALIPVWPPAELYTENRMFALPLLPAMLANSIANRGKSETFGAHMDAARRRLGPAMTRMVQEELATRGVPNALLDVPRSERWPDIFDYPRLPTRDALLHVWFSDVSMDSSRLSSVYVPRVNMGFGFLPRVDVPYDQQLYIDYRYGADAGSEDKGWSIPADPRYRWADFDALMAQSDAIGQSWLEGCRQIARRIARDLPSPAAG